MSERKIAKDIIDANRESRISVFVSPEEHDKLVRAARLAGMPLSTFVRSAALALARVQLRKELGD
jgi:uncharacterized protein (DUF1778 family)